MKFIEILKSKIHRAHVTEADLHYVGSITIDEDLMDAAGLIENEKVHVMNITNGERFITYVITGERGSGTIGINGAAAHKASIGDLIIIISFIGMDPEDARKYKPIVIFPDEHNKLNKDIEKTNP